MTDLESFRSETRAWLEANCPPEMREPMRDESDACWGGRNPVFKNEAQTARLNAPKPALGPVEGASSDLPHAAP